MNMTHKKIYICFDDDHYGATWQRGFNTDHVHFNDININESKRNGDIFVIRGRGLYQFMKDNGLNFLYTDSGYFNQPTENNPKGKKLYHRVAYNKFQGETILDVSNDRFNELGVVTKPWNTGGRHILIAPPSQKTFRLLDRNEDKDEWIDRVVNEIKEVSDRPIKIRHKVGNRGERIRQNPIMNDLDNCHCVVTGNSIIATEAITLGVPACVLDENAASPVAIKQLSDIENPIRPNREQWWNSLAYQQYTMDEVETGVCMDQVRTIFQI